MSVYIKSMTIPPEGEYRMTLYVCPDGSAYIDVASFPVDEDRFDAIPVPDHGRLIDADELAKEIEYARFHHSHTDGLAARHHVAEYGHFLNALSEFHTIIPADKEE